jgi:hypothetical protein
MLESGGRQIYSIKTLKEGKKKKKEGKSEKQTLDWDDELRDHGENLVITMLQKIMDSLACKESIGVLCLTQAIEKDREVVVVVQLVELDLLTKKSWEGRRERGVTHQESECINVQRIIPL